MAEGEDPAYVMAQLWHTDPKMTLGLYAKELRSKSRRADRALPGDINSTPVEARQAAAIASTRRRDTASMPAANLDLVTTVIDNTCCAVVGRRRFVG
jgi:hypothetical protein